jgi:hypothetical protein
VVVDDPRQGTPDYLVYVTAEDPLPADLRDALAQIN